MSVVIIGGGVCGLSIGWLLAQSGKSVTICDSGQAGKGATWAAAGMLAAQSETGPGKEKLLPLMQDSLERWPDFAAAIQTASDLDIGYRQEGTMVIARCGDDREALRFQYEYGRKHNFDLLWLNAEETRAYEPQLHRGVSAAFFSPRDYQVDNRRLAQALIIAFQRAGGRLHENCPVAAIEWEHNHVTGVRCAHGDRIPADCVVIAAGVWSSRIEGTPQEGDRLPVYPVKGQMLALGMDAKTPLISHNIWYRNIYLAPRRCGRLLIGATVEEKGFDETVTAGAMYHLLKRAHEILPDIQELPILETWAGLRPATPDNLPLLGPVTINARGDSQPSGLILATGHYRNGILLAPATAAYISQYCLSGVLAPAIRDFTLDRFSPHRRAA